MQPQSHLRTIFQLLNSAENYSYSLFIYYNNILFQFEHKKSSHVYFIYISKLSVLIVTLHKKRNTAKHSKKKF